MESTTLEKRWPENHCEVQSVVALHSGLYFPVFFYGTFDPLSWRGSIIPVEGAKSSTFFSDRDYWATGGKFR
jgi:hypothetical protein